MKWRWPLLILLFAALIYAADYAMQHAPTITVGDRYTYTLTTIDGDTVNEVNPDGGVTVVECWATYCGPCMELMPHLKQLQEKYRDDHVRFIGLNTDEEVAWQRKAIEHFQLTGWIHVNDFQQQQSVAGAWGVYGLPQTFLFSPTGELLWTGYPTELEQPLTEAIAKYARVESEK